MPPPPSPSERYAKPGRIDAHPKKSTWMGNSAFDILQNRSVPAFSDPRRPGMSVREISEDMAGMGYRLGPRGLMPDYMPDYMRNAAPQAQMTADEIRQANVNAAMANKSFEGIRRKFNRENPGKRMNKFGDIIEVKAKETAAPSADKGTLASVAGVDLEKLRPNFSATEVTIAPTPATPTGVTAAQRRQMLRDAATGRMDKFADGRLSEIQSSYGKGSVKMLKPGEARPVAMTTDEFGKPETMKSYLARREAIQGTKGMATDKSGKPVSRADFLAGWKAPQPNPRKA